MEQRRSSKTRNNHQEPGSKFITHTMPPNGESVAKSTIDSLSPSELSHIMAIGTDGTCANNGATKGAITRIQTYLKKKLHWNVRFRLILIF